MQESVDFIEKLFLCAMNNKNMIEACLESEVFCPMDVNIQETILNATVKHSLCMKYPPPKSFQRVFLKCLYNTVEKYGSECSDGLVEAYTKNVAEKCDDIESYYSYKINGKDIITLKENKYFVAKSTTGLRTWEASKYLSEWCLNNTSNFQNKSILELGSGIGLLGITVLKFASPSKYMFSDKSWEVLKLLSSNIEINFQDPKNIPIEQHQLVWSTLSDEEAKMLLPDIVLGADLVYDPDTIENLVHALKTSLVNSSSCAYIANTIRNPETNEIFLNHLDLANLNYELLQDHDKSIFIYNDSSSFVLYKIFKNTKNS